MLPRIKSLNSALTRPPWVFSRGRNSHVNRLEILIGKFEWNPKGYQIWAWLELYLIPKCYHLKQNRLHYQPLFKKGACANRPASRDQGKSSQKTEIRERFCYYYFFQGHCAMCHCSCPVVFFSACIYFILSTCTLKQNTKFVYCLLNYMAVPEEKHLRFEEGIFFSPPDNLCNKSLIKCELTGGIQNRNHSFHLEKRE